MGDQRRRETRPRRWSSQSANGKVFVVEHEDGDPLDPHTWSVWSRVAATLLIGGIAFVVGVASSIDSAVVKEVARGFDVSEEVATLATGRYLVGLGIGALFSGPCSETLGRNPVYVGTLSLYMVCIAAAGVAPNAGAQIAFRFLAGFFGSTPLTCAGGSIADLWSPLDRVYAFPVFANAAFVGPVLAHHLRLLTHDARYVSAPEARGDTFSSRLRAALIRPFVLTATEPIIGLIGVYLTVIYVVLFVFLDGFDYVFGRTYGTSLRGKPPSPLEFRLWYAMLGGSIAIPLSLVWMRLTAIPSIPVWSPLAASALFGYGILTVFISSYLYIIDTFAALSASALASVTLVRYVATGAMVSVGGLFYEHVGVRGTLGILAGASAVLARLPYVSYFYGERIRGRSAWVDRG
ncbi:major facilitator superfamily domain-containing protein [Phyllosticta citrichinensis]